MRVFVTHNPEDVDAYYGRSLPELRALANVVLNPLDRDLSTTELLEYSSSCEVIVAHRSTPGEATLFEQHPNLVAFLRCAVDVSTVDIEAASAAGVLVANADKSFVPSTAELAVGLMLDLARNISTSVVDYRQGQTPPQRSGHQMAGRTAGIIGYGAIGTYLARVLSGLGMHVIVADPEVDRFDSFIEHADADELLARSDVVFPLVPGPGNEGLIGAAELDRMPAGALLVNVSRGEVLDETAVAAALDSGHLGGLGIDVGQADDQRPSPDLARRADVVATPHLGGLTPENADAQAASSVEQVAAMIAGTIPPRALNADRADRLRRRWDT